MCRTNITSVGCHPRCTDATRFDMGILASIQNEKKKEKTNKNKFNAKLLFSNYKQQIKPTIFNMREFRFAHTSYYIIEYARS